MIISLWIFLKSDINFLDCWYLLVVAASLPEVYTVLSLIFINLFHKHTHTFLSWTAIDLKAFYIHFRTGFIFNKIAADVWPCSNTRITEQTGPKQSRHPWLNIHLPSRCIMFNMGCKAACRGIKIICYQLGLCDSWTSVSLFIEL